jgi:hypothetical protein
VGVCGPSLEVTSSLGPSKVGLGCFILSSGLRPSCLASPPRLAGPKATQLCHKDKINNACIMLYLGVLL